MGTSNPFGGGNNRNPLIPDWVDGGGEGPGAPPSRTDERQPQEQQRGHGQDGQFRGVADASQHRSGLAGHDRGGLPVQHLAGELAKVGAICGRARVVDERRGRDDDHTGGQASHDVRG